MPFNTTNLMLSMAMLNSAKLPQDKKIAASVGAAMMPGILGLVFPLIIARNSASANPDPPGTGATPGAGAGVPPGQADGPMQTMVPRVEGLLEKEALAAIEHAGLMPLIVRAYFKPADGASAPPAGQVASQVPRASAEWVDIGSSVRLEVSLGAPPEVASAASEHSHHSALETEIRSQMSEMDDKVDLILKRLNGDTQATH